MVRTRRNAGFTFAPALFLVLVPACSAGDGSNATEITDNAAAGTAATSSTTSGGASGAGGSGGSLFAGSGASGAGTGGGATASSSGSGVGGAGGGCGQMPAPGAPSAEACGDGLDNDLNGFVDEGCPCSPGQTQACFGGPPTWLSEPNCMKGTQTCQGNEFPGWSPCQNWACGPIPPPAEICDNGIDDDCDELIDEGCELNISVNIDGDCVFVSCPPQAPYPVGCNIIMEGGDSRGCVASIPSSSIVYFKEGDACPFIPGLPGAGHVSGSLTCSTVIGTGLNEQNCPINKTEKFYKSDANQCPN